jgi:hypothetical protein
VVGRKPGKLVGLSPSGVRISPSASGFSFSNVVQIFGYFFTYFFYYSTTIYSTTIYSTTIYSTVSTGLFLLDSSFTFPVLFHAFSSIPVHFYTIPVYFLYVVFLYYFHIFSFIQKSPINTFQSFRIFTFSEGRTQISLYTGSCM